MQRIFGIFVIISLAVSTCVFSQENDRRNQSNLLKYTPSLLLSKGQSEIKMFNNLYTQTAFYDASGNKIELNRLPKDIHH